MRWYEKIINCLTKITDQVSHIEHMQSERYIVWNERGYNDFVTGGKHAEKCYLAAVDLYTKQEFDPWIEQIEKEFENADFAWSLNSMQIEEDTGFFHYEWYIEVI